MKRCKDCKWMDSKATISGMSFPLCRNPKFNGTDNHNLTMACNANKNSFEPKEEIMKRCKDCINERRCAHSKHKTIHEWCLETNKTMYRRKRWKFWRPK